MAKYSEKRWLANDGMPMHAVRWQPDVEPIMTVCLIHGLGEHSGRYKDMVEYYTSCGVEIVSFDLRGHGKSGGQRGHSADFQQMIRDIKCFIDEVSNIDVAKPWFIYGHSLGATLTIQYALSHPIRFKGVVLSSPLFKPAFEPAKWKLLLGRLVQTGWPTLSLSNEINEVALCRDKEILKSRAEDSLIHHRISARLGIQMLSEGEQLSRKASEVDFPVLLMHGDADAITSHTASTIFAERVGQQCCLKIWQGFYHELHHEPEKEKVFEYGLNWMKRELQRL
ncbi:MAG: alpha-beta hydrolase superfamily lysophospholipase [Cycloclasticus pugetii]|jgi:alpha-beta hydrolase superfamily lysophospholipase|uniref:alpha/beta hydrolase n=1 Tax=Cycloclasticus pugetii TaxID=34068 RepID=UPI0039E2C2D7